MEISMRSPANQAFTGKISADGHAPNDAAADLARKLMPNLTVEEIWQK